MPLHCCKNFWICNKITLSRRNLMLLILKERDKLIIINKAMDKSPYSYQQWRQEYLQHQITESFAYHLLSQFLQNLGESGHHFLQTKSRYNYAQWHQDIDRLTKIILLYSHLHVSLPHFWSHFFIKRNISMSLYRVVCCSHQSDPCIRLCISHQSGSH